MMNVKRPLYIMSFRAFYRMSKDQDQYAEVAFRFVSRLPTDIRFALDSRKFVTFEEFARKYHALFMTRKRRVVVYLKNMRTQKVANVGLSLEKDWPALKTWRHKVARSGFIDITDAVSSIC
jgi:hypothetical protein